MKKNDNNTSQIIDKILENISLDLDYKQSIIIIKSIIEQIEQRIHNINVDQLLNELFNNKKIECLIKNIVDSSIKENQIELSNIKRLYNNEQFINLIENYCLNNNIIIIEKTNDTILGDVDISDGLNIYLKEVRKYPLLSRDEEIYYGSLAKSGDEKARNKLVESNLRLVVKTALEFKRNNPTIDFSDLIQSGNIGLIRAAELFDYTMGYRFSTYANWWIKQGISSTIKNDKDLIRKPVEIVNLTFKMRKIRSELLIKLKRQPTKNEIAQAMNISLSKLNDLLKYDNVTLSMNEKCSDDEETEIGEFIADDTNIEDEIVKKISREEMIKIINNSKLNDKEKDVIFKRYGFETGYPMTLEQISLIYGVTRERIRGIESTALKKIRLIFKDLDEELFYQRMHMTPPKKQINQICLKQEIKQRPKVEKKYEYGIPAKTEEMIIWNRYYRLVKVCLRNNKEIPVNFKTKNGLTYSEDGLNIYAWLEEQKNLYYHDELTTTQARALEEINALEEKWMFMYRLMQTYIEIYREYTINNNFKTFDGVDYNKNGYELGIWYNEELFKYVNNIMQPEYETLFDSIARKGLRKERIIN